MLYRLVKWIARLTLNSYFRKIVITGIDRIPKNGSVIFVANHPSAFMDPMVIATRMNRSNHFLAAAEFFGSGIKSWLYTNQLNMIPVYRPSTLPNETHNNDLIFSHCFKLLANGGALLVFPEGNSITEKRIRKLKTGVARMALGTRDHSKNKTEVEIVPIGLNYSNPHRFQSDLFINIGEPISTREFSNENSEVIRLTGLIEDRLKETVLHIQHHELDSVIKKIELLFKNKTESDGQKSKEEEFSAQQKIVKSIENLNATQPDVISQLEQKLDHYLNEIKNLGISDGSIARLSMLISLRDFIKLVFTLPVFLTGFVINSIPYYATLYYFRKLKLFAREGFQPAQEKINPAFKGSVSMAIGMAFFIIWYLAFAAIIVLITSNIWIGIVSLTLFYFSGLFAMRYIRWFTFFIQKMKLRKLLSQNQKLFTALIIERENIIKELKALTNNS